MCLICLGRYDYGKWVLTYCELALYNRNNRIRSPWLSYRLKPKEPSSRAVIEALLYNIFPNNLTYIFPYLKHPLRTSHLPLLSRYSRASHPTCYRQRLKCTLRPMMIIAPPNYINMQRHARRHSPAAQSMVNHLAIQLSNHWPLKPKFSNKERAR